MASVAEGGASDRRLHLAQRFRVQLAFHLSSQAALKRIQRELKSKIPIRSNSGRQLMMANRPRKRHMFRQRRAIDAFKCPRLLGRTDWINS